MARYEASVETLWTPEEAFAYLSDFSTSAEWDPGVVEAERVGGAAPGDGAEVRLVARFLGRTTELTYRTVEHEPPHAVTFLGENATVTSRDRITFDAVPGGTRITYVADLRLKGLLRLADPLLRLASTGSATGRSPGCATSSAVPLRSRLGPSDAERLGLPAAPGRGRGGRRLVRAHGRGRHVGLVRMRPARLTGPPA